MSWEYLTLSEAAEFMWHLGAAQEWDFNDFAEMVKVIEKDTFYGYIKNNECLGLVRVTWIMNPYSGYFWIWVKKDLRRKTKGYLESVRIFSSLKELFEKRIKVTKLVALCVNKDVARLCQRYGAEIKCILNDLYYKNKSAFICYWEFDR